MKTYKIKGMNCYVSIDQESVDDFNIDSDLSGFVADYEYVARYFLAQSELLGHNEPFEIEEVTAINHEVGVLFEK